jgi:hypothetical protein
VTEGFEPIRSYQRIFRVERRIYSIEGRPLPIPGGVPLRWLAYATGTLLAVLALGSGSVAVALALSAIAGVAGLRSGGRLGGLLAAGAALATAGAGGWMLGLLDWPLRLIVIPAAVATLATQATPDGRRADRFALSWLRLRFVPLRLSAGRALPAIGHPQRLEGELWVSPDERSPRLRRGRVRGPAVVFVSVPIALRRVGLRRRALLASEPGRDPRRPSPKPRRLTLGRGEILEVRP